MYFVNNQEFLLKILVIGSGGREHALVKAFRRSPSVSEIHVAPGSDGMTREALVHGLDPLRPQEIIDFCVKTEIDFVMIGPEDPLVRGLADQLRDRGLLCVGPSQLAAKLEGSKIFAKEFMYKAGVPTAEARVVSSVQETLEAAKKFSPPFVLKAEGLAAGKGVSINKNLEELRTSAEALFERRIFGEAGARALLEAYMPGRELSFLVLTNGSDFRALPLAQDHKRLRDFDQGPNTGGMGTFAPLDISASLQRQIEDEIIWPTVKEISSQGLVYRGVIFVGVMLTEEGPRVIEYNVRFGDPETQVILPLIQNDLGIVFKKLSQGELEDIRVNPLHSCCVVLAAPGYPEAPQRGIPIVGDPHFETNSSYFVHAGSQLHGDQWQTQGGRVLGAVGLGSTREEARVLAYAQAQKISWEGLQLRQDIGSTKQ